MHCKYSANNGAKRSSQSRLVRKFVATHQKHANKIAQAQFEQQPEHDHLEHDICRELKIVERRIGALIELALTLTAAEASISQIRSII